MTTPVQLSDDIWYDSDDEIIIVGLGAVSLNLSIEEFMSHFVSLEIAKDKLVSDHGFTIVSISEAGEVRLNCIKEDKTDNEFH